MTSHEDSTSCFSAKWKDSTCNLISTLLPVNTAVTHFLHKLNLFWRKLYGVTVAVTCFERYLGIGCYIHQFASLLNSCFHSLYFMLRIRLAA